MKLEDVVRKTAFIFCTSVTEVTNERHATGFLRQKCAQQQQQQRRQQGRKVQSCLKFEILNGLGEFPEINWCTDVAFMFNISTAKKDYLG